MFWKRQMSHNDKSQQTCHFCKPMTIKTKNCPVIGCHQHGIGHLHWKFALTIGPNLSLPLQHLNLAKLWPWQRHAFPMDDLNCLHETWEVKVQSRIGSLFWNVFSLTELDPWANTWMCGPIEAWIKGFRRKMHFACWIGFKRENAQPCNLTNNWKKPAWSHQTQEAHGEWMRHAQWVAWCGGGLKDFGGSTKNPF